MDSILVFALSSFLAIFAQVFQNRNVNTHKYTLAFFGAFFLGLSQGFVWKIVVIDGASLPMLLLYCLMGGFGCVAGMWAHNTFVTKGKG